VLIVSVIVQSNCHILQFLHQMFNVSALLYWTTHSSNLLLQKLSCFLLLLWRHFHKVVWQNNWAVVGSLVIVLLQIFSWFWEWNNYENRLIFVKLRHTKNCAIFLGHPVYTTRTNTGTRYENNKHDNLAW